MPSMKIGITGLQSSSKSLSAISNNIANTNTVGYKSLRAQFADSYSGSSVTGGAYVSQVKQSFNQGQITYTQNPNDMAIKGQGFFLTKDSAGLSYYTRAGYFERNEEGYLTNNEGFKLQGFPSDKDGNIASSQLQSIRIDNSSMPSAKTSKITLEVNLSSGNKEPEVKDFNPENRASYNYSSTSTIYDAQGNAHSVAAYYIREQGDDGNSWKVIYRVNGNESKVDVAGNEQDFSQLKFNAQGQIEDPYTPPKLRINTGSAGEQTIEIDQSKFTKYATPDAVSVNKQDGYQAGLFTGTSTTPDGKITAKYSNGETRVLGIIPIAIFPNNNGLKAETGTNWVATNESGAPIVGTPGQGNIGSLVAGALESSNVDMTKELVDMVVTQSAYQANAKTIQAADKTTQTLMQAILAGRVNG